MKCKRGETKLSHLKVGWPVTTPGQQSVGVAHPTPPHLTSVHRPPKRSTNHPIEIHDAQRP